MLPFSLSRFTQPLQKELLGAGYVTCLVKCLPSMHEALCSLTTALGKPGTVIRAYHPRILEVEAGEAETCGQQLVLRPAWAADPLCQKQREQLDFCLWETLVLKEQSGEGEGSARFWGL